MKEASGIWKELNYIINSRNFGMQLIALSKSPPDWSLTECTRGTLNRCIK